MAIRRISNIGGMLTQAGQQQAEMLGQGASAFGTGVGAGLGAIGQGVLTGMQQRDVQQALTEFKDNPAKLDELAAQYAARQEDEIANAFTAAAKNARLAATQSALKGMDLSDPKSILATGREVMGQDIEAGLGLVTQAASMQRAQTKGVRMAANLKRTFGGATNEAVNALAAELENVATEEGLSTLLTSYLALMQEKIPISGKPERFAVLMGVIPNLTDQMYKDLGVDNMNDKFFNDFASGLSGGQITPFIYEKADGTQETKAFRELNGLVYVGGKYVTPEEAGILAKAPHVERIENAAASFQDEIVKKNAEGFFDLHTQAKSARQGIEGISETIDGIENMTTGSMANQLVAVQKFFSQLGLDLDMTNVTTFEEFMAKSGVRVAGYIKNLGSGNGITDKDLEFTRQVIGGSATLEKSSLVAILREFEAASIKKINGYNAVQAKTYSEYKKAGGNPDLDMSSFMPISLPESRYGVDIEAVEKVGP
tara:strand:- start:130 stop:1581 length:1452 start_codon:yes stop_codon:yes gene_type:complete